MKNTLLFGWILFLGFLLHIAANRSEPSTPTYTPPMWLSTPPEVRNILSLGQTNLYHDYLFLWTIQEVTEPRRAGSDVDKVLNTLTSIAQEKIPFEAYYMMACFVANEKYQKPEHCESITFEGLKAFPVSWRILMTQAYIDAFQLENIAKGATLYEFASKSKLAPPWVASLAKKLRANPDITEKDIERIQRLMKDIPGFLDENLIPENHQ